MHQPVSVCHQWSITGRPEQAIAQSTVAASARSPARNSARSPPMSWRRNPSPSGSSFLIARSAVGAVNSDTTSHSAQTRQKAAASGVPTGLPS